MFPHSRSPLVELITLREYIASGPALGKYMTTVSTLKERLGNIHIYLSVCVKFYG